MIKIEITLEHTEKDELQVEMCSIRKDEHESEMFVKAAIERLIDELLDITYNKVTKGTETAKVEETEFSIEAAKAKLDAMKLDDNFFNKHRDIDI